MSTFLLADLFASAALFVAGTLQLVLIILGLPPGAQERSAYFTPDAETCGLFHLSIGTAMMLTGGFAFVLL